MNSKVNYRGRVKLGDVRAPSGAVATLDCGLMYLWCHDQTPRLQEGVLGSGEATADTNNSADLRLGGPDAEACGLAYDRSHHPLYLYDIPGTAVSKSIQQLREFADARGFDIEIELVRPQVPHLQRARDILTREAGASVTFHGIWGSVVGDLPRDSVLPVYAEEYPDEEFAGRWQRVYIEVRAAEIAATEPAGWAMVDEARLMFCDLDRLGVWNDDQSFDGLADLMFWGRDAEELAKDFGAPARGESEFGWKDLPVDTAVELGQRLEAVRDQGVLKFAFDFRPHTHHWQALEQVRNGDTESGVVVLDDAPATVFMTTWGDGIYEVYRDLNADGDLVRVRVELGTEKTVSRMRALRERTLGLLSHRALLTRRAWDEGVMFCYREPPDNESDSGWRMFHGNESDEYANDPENIIVRPLWELVDRDASLDRIVREPAGRLWERGTLDAVFAVVED